MVNGYEICTSCGSISAIEIPLDVPDVKHLNVLLEVVEKYWKWEVPIVKCLEALVVVKYWKELVV